MSPSRYTKPLAEDFKAAIDPYLDAIQYIWRNTYGYELEAWQVELLRLITEVHNGKLRWRQYVVSMGRQNGKTEIAAALGLWRMLSNPNALVIGIASSAQQANIVYKRILQAVTTNPALARRFTATETRGIKSTSASGTYEIKAAKYAALQGLPIELGIVDEVHLLKMDLWTSLVNGTGGRDNTLVVGITTAGDETSELLKYLYDLGDKALIQPASFGFAVWEASEARVPDSDEELGQLLMEANPALASGRVAMANVIEDVRAMPESDVLRYRLNRFVSAQASFITGDMWQRNARELDEHFPEGKSVVGIDVDPDRRFASIVRARKDGDLTYTELVASVPNPTDALLESMARWLYSKGQVDTFVMDALYLRTLGERLKSLGYPVKMTYKRDLLVASPLLYSKLAHSHIRHENHPVLAMQLPATVRKNSGDGYIISRKDTVVVIDAVMATVFAVYGADSKAISGPLIV